MTTKDQTRPFAEIDADFKAAQAALTEAAAAVQAAANILAGDLQSDILTEALIRAQARERGLAARVKQLSDERRAALPAHLATEYVALQLSAAAAQQEHQDALEAFDKLRADTLAKLEERRDEITSQGSHAHNLTVEIEQFIRHHVRLEVEADRIRKDEVDLLTGEIQGAINRQKAD